ncbi:unnamed protein product [Cylicocyclus nassatus]|uniref:Uncharacterized protein n=1 Tax=Cylicocyclus nassatus TaxID=53992 RepID=A0AA36GVP6_CYLNA|nr:unnamed protein product [Cylicocyclus nassatus]
MLPPKSYVFENAQVYFITDHCPNPVQSDWKIKKMDILTTEGSASSDGLVGYTGFLLVLASFTLILGGVICCARIAFMYCTFRRRREEELERARRTATTATETEQGLSYPRACGIANHAFDDPPPRYDQVYKDDEPPPLYETLGNYGGARTNSAAERRTPTTANEQIPGRAPESRAHERAPSYSVYIPPDSRSAPPRQDSVSDIAIPISTTSRQIQNYMEEVRERFSGNVDLFISSLSITTPPPTEHRPT